MEYSFNKKNVGAYLLAYAGRVKCVSEGFIKLTGFTKVEVLGKALNEIGNMLKINSQIYLTDIKKNYSGFIFGKYLEAIEVNISSFLEKETNEYKYTFVEKINSRLEDKLMFEKDIFRENIVAAAIYSSKDSILLKANQKYLDFWDAPFNRIENSIGKPIKECAKGFEGSSREDIWNSIIKEGKTSYIKNSTFDKFGGGKTYWESTVRPVFEKGKIKYVFDTNIEVTERVSEKQDKVIKNNTMEHQNRQLMDIIENLAEGVLLTDNKGKIILANQEAKSLMYKYEEVKVLGDLCKYSKHFDSQGNELNIKDLPGIRAMNGETLKNDVMKIINPEREFYIRNSSIPIYDAKGELTNVVSCFHEITEYINQSKKIEEQKKELGAVLENISDGIFIFDKNGKYTFFNKTAREVFLPIYSGLECIGDNDNKAKYYDIDGKLISVNNIPARRVLRGEKFRNMRIIVKTTGKTLQKDVSGTPIYDDNGNFILGVLCSRDMTEYFKQGEAERNKLKFMNRIIDTFDLPVIRVSCPDLKVINANKKAFTIIKSFGKDINSMKQVKMNTFENIFGEFSTSEYNRYIKKVLKEKKTIYLNKKSHVLNGNRIYWNVVFDPVADEKNELKEILILIIDVTKEIKSNINMEKSMKGQEEFFVNISHELKTPVNVIFASAQLLNMYSNKGFLDEQRDSIAKCIGSIKQNSYRLSKLINNMLDLSKIEAGFFELNLSNNNIVAIVEETVTSVTDYINIKGLSIIFDTDIKEKIIACDVEKVERTILNLISNAIKFSDKGELILVKIKNKDKFLEISVKDYGIGLDSKDFDLIFDRFRQVDKSLSRNAEGTGMGLSLVKAIVEMHGGNIKVESKLGEGSKFTVLLPNKTVVEENKLFNNKIRNNNESVQVELSDISS